VNKYFLSSQEQLDHLITISNWRPNLSREMASVLILTQKKNIVFNTLLKKTPKNNNIFSILNFLSAYIKITDDVTQNRHRQILYFFSKVLVMTEFMNYFLLDLSLQWFLEQCQKEEAFLDLLLSESRDLLYILQDFNHKIRSVDSIRAQGILFNLESLGYLGILQNSQKTEKIDKILSHKTKTRKNMLTHLSKREPIRVVFPNFEGPSGHARVPQEGMVASFREESFYSVDCKVHRVLGFLVALKFISMKSGKAKEKICVLPFDHPCLVYPAE
jgi:hypothetical protein